MKLVIKNPFNLDLDNFCIYLFQFLRRESYNEANFNAKLIAQWNDYLSVVFPDITLSLQQIVQEYFNNLIYEQSDKEYTITCNKNIKVDDISLDKLVQTISQGSLDIKGYSIFEDIYQKVADEIPYLYKQWEAIN